MNLLKRNKEYSKKKSIIMLSIYGVFFIFVFILLLTGKDEDSFKSYKDYMNSETKTGEKTDNEVKNYEYLYKITDNTKTTEISGTKTSDKELFEIDGKKYYKQDNNIYLNDGTDTLVTDAIFNTDLYSYSNIEGLFKDKKAKEKTVYEDDTIKEIYNINSKDYFDYMKEDKCNDIDCSTIFIDITINRNNKEQIEKANIDLTNFYKYKYIIELNYNNINNIKEVSTN